MLTQPLKWHGGKAYLADWIIGLMPERVRDPNKPAADDLGWLHFVEPYFGGGAVLLRQDPTGISEVVNDLNFQLTNFWRALKNPEWFAQMRQALAATPFSDVEYRDAEKRLQQAPSVGGPEQAAAFFIWCRQSMSGRMKNFAPLTRNRTRRGMNEQASAWLNALDGLPEVHARLQRVVILNSDALSVIKQQDGPRTLFYLDPPYFHLTRVTTSEYGQFEMTADDHAALLDLLSNIEGKFMLSGYRCPMYDYWALTNRFKRHEMKIDNKSSSKKSKDEKTECVWTNF